MQPKPLQVATTGATTAPHWVFPDAAIQGHGIPVMVDRLGYQDISSGHQVCPAIPGGG